MPADTQFVAAVTSAQEMLQRTSDLYNNKYKTLVGNQGTAGAQVNSLQNQVIALNAKLENVKTLSDTYDREFLDRTSGKNPIGFWQSRGLSTLQDWVLFFFYLVYGLITLGILLLVITFSNTALYSGFMVLALSVILGVMMTAVIIRFA